MYYIYKNRIYVKSPSEAPEGVKVETGERGGIYYEFEGQSSLQEKEPKQEISFEVKLKNNEISEYKNQIINLNSEQLMNETDKIYTKNFDVAGFMRGWYRTDHGHLYLDDAITKIFELNKLTSRTSKDTSTTKELNNKDINDIKEIYTITQTHLRKKYPNGKITLYRGVNGKTYNKFKVKEINEGGLINLECYNISSWSESKDIAKKFALQNKVDSHGAVVLSTEISIERVFSHYEIDPIALSSEKEAIIIGSEILGKIEQLYGATS